MNEINKTLYIPLYGKAMVSKRGIILNDKTAEKIWQNEGFTLGRKSRSRWLAYFMAMRARIFDDWTEKRISEAGEDTVVLHIGCGMDSRCERVGSRAKIWYDIDLPDVIAERKKYFSDDGHYKMLGADAKNTKFIKKLPEAGSLILILEGISMYMMPEDTKRLLSDIGEKYERVYILMDVYTSLGAKMSRYKNPVNEVGVTAVWGIDDPASVIENNGISFIAEHDMTPEHLVCELRGFERSFFAFMFGGKMAKMLYKIFEYKK